MKALKIILQIVFVILLMPVVLISFAGFLADQILDSQTLKKLTNVLNI